METIGMIALNSSECNPTRHIFNSEKICRVELCIELFYAIIPTLLILYTIVLTGYLVSSTYFCCVRPVARGRGIGGFR